MAELEIPDHAWEVFGNHLNYHVVKAMPEAAKIVVAAELRRMANVCDGAPLGSFWGMTELRMRADELDPPCGS